MHQYVIFFFWGRYRQHYFEFDHLSWLYQSGYTLVLAVIAIHSMKGPLLAQF